MATITIPDGELIFAAESARQMAQDIRETLDRETMDTDTYLAQRGRAVKLEMLAELFESALGRNAS